MSFTRLDRGDTFTNGFDNARCFMTLSEKSSIDRERKFSYKDHREDAFGIETIQRVGIGMTQSGEKILNTNIVRPSLGNRRVSLHTFTRTSPLLGGATSTSSMLKGLFAFQATAALHLIVCWKRNGEGRIDLDEVTYTLCRGILGAHPSLSDLQKE
jgi:hypothetical protein